MPVLTTKKSNTRTLMNVLRFLFTNNLNNILSAEMNIVTMTSSLKKQPTKEIKIKDIVDLFKTVVYMYMYSALRIYMHKTRTSVCGKVSDVVTQ